MKKLEFNLVAGALCRPHMKPTDSNPGVVRYVLQHRYKKLYATIPVSQEQHQYYQLEYAQDTTSNVKELQRKDMG